MKRGMNRREVAEASEVLDRRVRENPSQSKTKRPRSQMKRIRKVCDFEYTNTTWDGLVQMHLAPLFTLNHITIPFPKQNWKYIKTI